jgi:hypothetical protein
MDLDIREQKLRQRIEEQGNTLCPTTFKELLANKFQRAQNFYMAHKKFDDQHSGIKSNASLEPTIKSSKWAESRMTLTAKT